MGRVRTLCTRTRREEEKREKKIQINSEEYVRTFILFNHIVEEVLEVVPVLDVPRALGASGDIELIVFG
jgi:hypothetical protein